MNIGNEGFIACDKPATFWYRHNDDICSYCDEHNYACGEMVRPDKNESNDDIPSTNGWILRYGAFIIQPWIDKYGTRPEFNNIGAARAYRKANGLMGLVPSQLGESDSRFETRVQRYLDSEEWFEDARQV